MPKFIHPEMNHLDGASRLFFAGFQFFLHDYIPFLPLSSPLLPFTCIFLPVSSYIHTR